MQMAAAGQHQRPSPPMNSRLPTDRERSAVSVAHRVLHLAKLAATTLAALVAVAKALGLL